MHNKTEAAFLEGRRKFLPIVVVVVVGMSSHRDEVESINPRYRLTIVYLLGNAAISWLRVDFFSAIRTIAAL